MSGLKLSTGQVKAGRALLGWSQDRLADASGVSVPTIKRLEAEGGVLGGRPDTVAKIRQALETAGIEFTNGDAPGVRLLRPRP
jgi:transcriptional regulator with XRE-family HTH domain